MSKTVKIIFLLFLATLFTLCNAKARGNRAGANTELKVRGGSMNEYESKQTAIEAAIEEYEERTGAVYSYGIIQNHGVTIEEDGESTVFVIELVIGETNCIRDTPIYDYDDRTECLFTGKNKKFCVFTLSIVIDNIDLKDDCQDVY